MSRCIDMVHRIILLLLTAALSLGAAAQELGADAARHLLNRTGFSASPAEVETFARLTREQAADRLLRGAGTQARQPPPEWVEEAIIPPYRLRKLSAEERMRFQRESIERGLDLRAWWLREMLTTPSPLTEKMTLFWHNHFATSLQKVRFGQVMYRQNVLLRRHALGNFGVLLKDVARDPAMVIYLDNFQNRVGQPNENYARELMELFTLGEGQFTEQDVKEVARAFTGWSLDRDSGEFMLRPLLHDKGNKTVLGRSGNLDGMQVLDILLAQPQTAEFITRKLWKEFISPLPDDEEAHRFARLFRNSRYDIKVLLRAILTSEAFYATRHRGVLVKSPVELVVGTLRQFNVEAPDLRAFAIATAYLGQNLFAPPNVKGWPGGEAWINSTTLLGRRLFVERLFRTDERGVENNGPPELTRDEHLQKRMDRRRGHRDRQKGSGDARDGAAGPDGGDSPPTPEEQAQRLRHILQRSLAGVRVDLPGWSAQFKAADREQAMTRTLLALAPQQAVSMRNADVNQLVRQLVADPTYQLK